MAAVVGDVECVRIGLRVAIKKELVAHTHGGKDKVTVGGQPLAQEVLEHGKGKKNGVLVV